MTKFFFFYACLLRIVSSKHINGEEYCNEGDACWPTNDEINELYNSLDPEEERSVTWESTTSPRTCSVPVGSKYDQPFYGAYNETIEPLYFNSSAVNGQCFLQPLFNPELNSPGRQVCLSSIRNNPLNDWQPAFVAWPLNANHVSSIVKFAVDHNLCIMVAGTGHDFLNRHSCPNGMLIRTTLLKSVSWDMEYNNGVGSVTLGTGHTFSEVAYEATLKNRLIAQGWAVSVGVTGWSFGGGHGPFANYAGLGVDNIISATIVDANGNILFVNETNEYNDLWWALRGGGGSTWGVVIDVTIQAHLFPEDSMGGIEEYFIYWQGNNCEDDGILKRSTIIHEYLNWSLTLDEKWSGLTFIIPQVSSDSNDCGGNWTLFIEFNYLGNLTGVNGGDEIWANFVNSISYRSPYKFSKTFSSQWDRAVQYDLEVIYPYNWLGPSAAYVGGVASVLISRDTVINGNFENIVNERLLDCDIKYGTSAVCSTQQFYQDITGNLNTNQNPNTSISNNFRDAFIHYVVGSYNHTLMETIYSLGENSYFSESAYEIGDSSNMASTPLAGTWQTRYWDDDDYDMLLSIKNKYDPNHVFWCRHCMGDDENDNDSTF